MFVETKNEGEIEIPGCFNLTGFIAWLEARDPNETYVYADAKNCALGQYSRSIGCVPRQFVDRVAIEWGINQWALANALSNQPCTFGAALSRLRAELRQ